MKKKILLGLIVLVAISFGLKKELVPNKIDTISIRYAPLYNIATAEILNEHTEGGYIEFQTIKLEGSEFEKVSKLLKDVHEDKSYYKTDSIIGDDYEIIINDDFKITGGNTLGQINDQNGTVVGISSELSDEIYSIIQNNNNKIFKSISCNKATIEKDNKSIVIDNTNGLNTILDNFKFIKVNIKDDFRTYDGGYYATIKFDDNMILYLYNASIIGYVEDLETNESYFVGIGSNLYSIVDSLMLKKNNNLNGYIIHSGYISESKGNINRNNNKIIISDYNAFQNFCKTYNHYIYDGQGNIVSGNLDEFSKKYDKSYFDKNSLAIVYVELGSGSYSVKFDDYTINNNTIDINYEIIRPSNSIGTTDMNGYLVVVEVDKNITNIL